MIRSLPLLLAALTGTAMAQSHFLVENFTSALPSNAQITSEVNVTDPRVGLGAAKLTYQINRRTRTATLDLGNERRALTGPGIAKLWIKGDNSGNELTFFARMAKPQTEPDGRTTFSNSADVALPKVKLDFSGWKEVSLPLPAVPAGSKAWLQRLVLTAPNNVTQLTGTIELDDFRIYPEKGAPNAQTSVGLLGADRRELGLPLELFLDVRNFTATPAKLQIRVVVTDRNENTVVEREFTADVAGKEVKEIKLDLAPENLAAFLPPFKISGDVLSPELQDLSGRIDFSVVSGNSRYLFDNMSDAAARWFTAGSPQSPRNNPRSWITWTHGEAQRATPLTQTSARLSRVTLEPGQNTPPSRYALQIDYQGDALVYNGRQRYLPGNAYRAGFWVKGDGSNSRLFASFLDYTLGADAFEQGWKRTTEGEREIAQLDFTDWRYFEVELPGRGLGSNTPNGSTLGIDFPIELTALRIEAADPAKSGQVLIGPITTYTQLASLNALSVQIGYDDANHLWRPDANAVVTLQNSSLSGPRKVKANWTLLDRVGQPVVTGQVDVDLAVGEAKSVPIDLAKSAAEIQPRLAPFTLQVTAYDVADGSVSTTQQLILNQPDSQALVADFEMDRGYLGLKGREITNAPPDGEAAAHTTTDQAHGGQRSLAIDWDQDTFSRRFVSVDPPLPGVPVELSLWVYGDASGVLFYPLIGDRKGINHGLPNGQWNFFLPRTDGDLQNAVRVDWEGWRELKFKLPPAAANWNESSQSLGFVPNYPLGVHLAIDATSANKPSGRLFVDDLSVRTQLPPESRVALTLNRNGESNFHSPNTPVSVTLANYDLATQRRVRLSGGLFDWRGDRIAGTDETFELAPGERKRVDLARDFPPGFYLAKAELSETSGEKKQSLATLEEDILVADPAKTFGPEWVQILNDEWPLRRPVDASFSLVDEDWDWVEHHAGNLQVDTIKTRAHRVSEAGGEPYLLLGYSAYWASGIGFDQINSGTFVRIPRNRGQAVNTFMIPARLEDWDNYVQEVMRDAGKDVSGWIVWDGPDSAGPMGFTPDKFLPFLKSANQWREVYAADKPLLLGGMARDTAIPYLHELGKLGGLDSISGVNVRLDVGRLSPEAAGVVAYSRELRAALDSPESKTPKTILFTDFDWAVEKGGNGLTAFDQAAYLARAALLLDGTGIRSALTLRNEDYVRLGLGLAYRRDLSIPPLAEKPLTYQLKPAYWAMSQVRRWLTEAPISDHIDVQDVISGRTRCLIQRSKDGSTHAIIWRDDDAGQISFAEAGVTIESAEDLFGASVPQNDGWYSIGKIPCRFAIKAGSEPVPQALARLRVRDSSEGLWPQKVLAAFTPDQGSHERYTRSGGEKATLSGRTAEGEPREVPGVRFKAKDTEQFTVKVPAGSGLILRKQFLLDETGQEVEVNVNGKPVGQWNLLRSEKELSGGIRESIFVIDPPHLGGAQEAKVEIRYLTDGNTTAWRAFEGNTGDFPLSAVGAIHADQNVNAPRFARNIVGSPLKIGTETFENGIGTFARSLLEFPLNGQFKRFTSKAGVDAATDGRGSVVFEVYGDGKKLWSSPPMSGLDAAKEIDVDVTGVNRLRLVVSDAGDGNKFDVADWVNPTLKR